MRSVRFPPFGFVMKEIWSTLIYRMQFLHKDIFGKMWCMTICSNEELNGTVWFQCRLLIITFVTNFFIRGEVVFFSSRISVNYGHKLRLVAKKIKRNYIRKLRYLWWELVLVRAGTFLRCAVVQTGTCGGQEGCRHFDVLVFGMAGKVDALFAVKMHFW